MLGSSSNQQTTPAAAVTSTAQTVPSTQQEAPVVSTPAINETVTVSAESPRAEADKKTDAERKAEADKKARKAAADAKPTPENKKKVTVDDLINDN